MLRKASQFLAALLLTACAGLPGQIVLDTTPEPAAAAAWLVCQLDIQKPVMVTDGDLAARDLFGYTQNLGDCYMIVLDWHLEPQAKMMVLIHELAHVVHWEQGGAGGDHGPGWGEAYSQVFRVWVQEE